MKAIQEAQIHKREIVGEKRKGKKGGSINALQYADMNNSRGPIESHRC